MKTIRTIKIDISNSKITKVKFVKDNILGNTEFECKHMLNVITGPIDVGKTYLLKEICKDIRHNNTTILPVYFKFNLDSVENNFNNKEYCKGI